MSQTSISPRKVTAVLLAALVGLGLCATLLWFWIDVEPVPRPYLNIEDLPSTQMQSNSDVEAVLARPLFWEERQPVSVPEEDVAEVEKADASPLRGVKLLGIILTGDVRTALLNVEDKVISASAGQTIQGWEVETVTAKEVSFVAGTEHTVLSLVRERPDSILLETVK